MAEVFSTRKSLLILGHSSNGQVAQGISLNLVFTGD